MRKAVWFFFLMLAVLLLGSLTFAQLRIPSFNCEDPYSLCAERQYNRSYDSEYKGRYIGHDEPALLFYSDVPGSGNYSRYQLVLPKDPPTYPTDANRAGTGNPTVWNFQLHPTFWFGMALCDSESYPEFTHKCVPDTDDNIFDDPNPKSKGYIGRHPGSAFIEMQFYPPGWVNGYTQTQYAAAMLIFSYDVQALGPNGPIANNLDCQNKVGLEPGNFALVTLDGKAQAPGDPLASDPNRQAIIPGKTFLMNPGDHLIVTLHDTRAGLQVVIQDLTTGQTGRMTASVENGFTQVKFKPNASTCTSRPYAFHPMYATSSPHTRIVWAAHSFNIAFSDEIGHFNYCDAQDGSVLPGLLGACTSSPVEDVVVNGTHEADDMFCVDPSSSLIFGSLQPLGGCLDSDSDFDGVPYHHAWAGSGSDPWGFSAVPDPILITSPKFRPTGEDDEGELRNYRRAAFEADIPAIEDASVCDTLTGAGCVNPPPGALFYPIYTTTNIDGKCWWQFGGASIPGTTNTFGGSSATEYANLEGSVYTDGTRSHPGSVVNFENYYQALRNNPCR